MIKSVADLHEINKIIRSQLIEQTDLPGDNIINSLDTYGPELIKYLEDMDLYGSYDLKDTVILFEITSDPSRLNITTDEENDKIYAFSSYTVHLMIYGENSNAMVYIIKSRFESEEVRDILYRKGIHLTDIDLIGDINDFINNRIWLRSDMNINIEVRYEIEKKSKLENIENLKNINVIKKK